VPRRPASPHSILEQALNTALANAGKFVVNVVVARPGVGGVPANRADRPIQVRVIDDGGLEGGEARLEIFSDKS